MECEKHSENELKSIPSPKKSSPCFDCSICLDFAKDPVVTLCGHLYCWPCIYKWLSFSVDSNDNPVCPVCKSEISHTSLVPLYGRGKPFSGDTAVAAGGGSTVVPPRPRACTFETLTMASNPNQRHSNQNLHANYDSSLGFFGNDLDASNQNIWMFGEMIYERVFGNSESLYTFPNSYHHAGSNSPRLRRQEMQVHKSLNRLTVFLFCCFFLCLLLF